MDKDQILEVLRQHAPELRHAGILHLSLFGSTSRNEHTLHSDIDLLAEFDPHRRLTLVAIAALKQHLDELLDHTVDLSAASWLREPMRAPILKEAVVAF